MLSAQMRRINTHTHTHKPVNTHGHTAQATLDLTAQAEAV